MKCPKCGSEIIVVNISSECWQKASVDKDGEIIEYGKIEKMEDTIKIECVSCFADITKIIKE